MSKKKDNSKAKWADPIWEAQRKYGKTHILLEAPFEKEDGGKSCKTKQNV